MPGRTVRDNDNAIAAIITKIVAVITMPGGFLDVNTICIEPTRKIITQRNISQQRYKRKNL